MNQLIFAVCRVLFLISVLSACAREETTNSQASRQSSPNEGSVPGFNVWNGDETESADVAAAVNLEFRQSNALQIARNVGTATGYFRPGCFLTNRHVLGEEARPKINYIRIKGFSVMENAGLNIEPSRLAHEIEDDRLKLQQGLFYPVLQAKELIVGDALDIAAGKSGRDLAVFYVPPGGWRLEGGIPVLVKQPGNLGPVSQMFMDPNNFYRSKEIKASSLLDSVALGNHAEVRGYGLGAANRFITPGLNERVGIERKGTMIAGKFLECDKKSLPSLNSCLWIAFDPLPDKRQASMPGDSGAKISQNGGLVAINSMGAPLDPGMRGLPGRLAPKNPIPYPLDPNKRTVGVNLFERETYKFLTDPTYKLDEGRNVPVTCRPKPFINHGPAQMVSTINADGLTESDWILNPRVEGGFVRAKNIDEMHEYPDTEQICGREPRIAPSVSEQCGHSTWDNKAPNNGPLINLTLTAEPWADYKFKEWTSPKGAVCLCERTNPICRQTNEQVEERDPKRLHPFFRQICLAVFEKLPNLPGGCDRASQSGCGVGP